MPHQRSRLAEQLAGTGAITRARSRAQADIPQDGDQVDYMELPPSIGVVQPSTGDEIVPASPSLAPEREPSARRDVNTGTAPQVEARRQEARSTRPTRGSRPSRNSTIQVDATTLPRRDNMEPLPVLGSTFGEFECARMCSDMARNLRQEMHDSFDQLLSPIRRRLDEHHARVMDRSLESGIRLLRTDVNDALERVHRLRVDLGRLADHVEREFEARRSPAPMQEPQAPVEEASVKSDDRLDEGAIVEEILREREERRAGRDENWSRRKKELRRKVLEIVERHRDREGGDPDDDGGSSSSSDGESSSEDDDRRRSDEDKDRSRSRSRSRRRSSRDRRRSRSRSRRGSKRARSRDRTRSPRRSATRGEEGAFRRKGYDYRGLKPIRATNPLYKERLDYRYYRLKKTKARRTGFETGKIKDQIRRMAYSLEEHLFTGEKPILILDFLARFCDEADTLEMSEAQAYVALPYFLKSTAKDAFKATKNTSRGEDGGVTCWPEAVQYLLRSYATPNAIRGAITALRELKQRSHESEEHYSTRLTQAILTAGSVHSAEAKKDIFVDGLISAIRAVCTRHRERHPGETYLQLLEHARAEGESYRARNNIRVRNSDDDARAKPTKGRSGRVLHVDTPQSSVEVRNPQSLTGLGSMSRFGHDNVNLLGEGRSSIPTSELPSTGEGARSQSQDSAMSIEKGDDPALAMQGGYRNVPAPRMAYDQGTSMRHQRPGWVSRSPSPRRGPPSRDIICYSCYEVGTHLSTECPVTLSNLKVVRENYARLTEAQKERVPSNAYELAIARNTPARSDERQVGGDTNNSQQRDPKGSR